MEFLRNPTLMESHRQDLEREIEQARLGAALPHLPFPWRAWLVMAVLFIGMVAWLIH